MFDPAFSNLKSQAQKVEKDAKRAEITDQIEEFDYIRKYGSFKKRRRERSTGLFGLAVLLVIVVVFCGFGGLLAKYYGFDFATLVPKAPIQTQVSSNPFSTQVGGQYNTPVVNDPNSFPAVPQVTATPTILMPPTAMPTFVPTQIIVAPAGTIGYVDPNWPTTPVLTNSSNHPQPVSNVNLSTVPLYDGLIGSSPEQVVCQYGSTFFYIGPGFRDVVVLTTSSNPGSITIQTPWDWPGNATVFCPSETAILIVYAK